MSTATVLPLEKHYSVKQLADMWGVSEATIRRIFRDMPGVLKISAPRLLARDRKNSPPVRLSIPESLVLRAHEQWSRALPFEVKPRNRGV